MRKRILMAMTAILVLALATAAMAADPFVGTWKLNVAKSKFPQGQALKSWTTNDEAKEDGMIKSIHEGVGADGQAFHREFTWKYDGKDYPVKGDPTADAIAFRRINANTYDYMIKKGGKEVGSGRLVFSKDGKTDTITGKTKDAQGQEVTSISVLEKQ
jgi:hypothetical protein